MPRNSEEDRIIAALQRTEHSLDKAATMQQHQTGNMDKVVKGLETVDVAHTAWNVAKGINPKTGVTYVTGKLLGKMAPEGSLTRDIADQTAYAALLAQTIAKPDPLSIGLTALETPAALKRQFYDIPKKTVDNVVGFAKSQASIVGEAGGELAKGMKEERGERQASAVFKSINKLSEVGGGVPATALTASNLIANPMSIVPTLEILAGPLMLKVTERLRDFSEKLHSSNQQFEEFSGGMSAVMAMQQARDIELGQERGDRRALSAGYLAEGKHELNKNMGSIEDLFATVKNLGAGLFDRLAASITKPFAEQADSLQKLVDAIAKKFGIDTSQQDETAADFTSAGLSSLRNQAAEHGRPKRF